MTLPPIVLPSREPCEPHRDFAPRPVAARADEAVADDPQRLDLQRGVVLAEANGDDAGVVGHEPETTPATVAALYVDPKGVYANLPGVEVWDEARDARLYAGPWPVVAHPPCTRWCMFAPGIETKFGYRVGDDGGTFAAALEAVRTFGGVLEHPAHSLAWDAYDLPVPVTPYAWTLSLFDGGATCYVEQIRYGHLLRKATWLYAHGVDLPDLEWGRLPSWERGEYRWSGIQTDRDHDRPRVPQSWLDHTPEPFRDVLLGMARSVPVQVAA